MNLTGLLAHCHQAVRPKQLQQLSPSLTAMLLPAVLMLGLCSCMLWQCSTCLLKYFSRPLGASVAFSQDLSQFPIALTLCNKDAELNYTFPELGAVEVRQGPGVSWLPVWKSVGSAGVGGGVSGASSVTVETFVNINLQGKQRLCQTIHVHESRPRELRLRHFYSNICNLRKMAVYLHSRGLFFAKDFAILLPKSLFSNEENLVLELSLETMTSLPTADFKCSQDEVTGVQTRDRCLLDEALRAANQSAGCISRDLR